MEHQLVKNMKDHFMLFGGISVIYGVLSVLCLYKNLMGVTAPLFVLVTIVVVMKFMKLSAMAVKRRTMIYFAGMLVLGGICFYTANYLLVLFAWFGTFVIFISAMLYQFYEEDLEFPDYVCRFAVLCGTTVMSVSDPFRHMTEYLEKKNDTKRKNVLAVIYGAAAALIFLAVVFPLLVQSDEIFGRFFVKLLENFKIGNIAAVLTIFIIFTLASYAFFFALCRKNLGSVQMIKNTEVNAISGITFTAVLAVVYAVYCSVQFLYLVLQYGDGLPEGMTYSQYAHSGFWQLVVVAGINVVTVLICKAIFKEHKILKITLSIVSFCTFMMIISAAYKMILYVKEYQLTFLRFLVLCFLVMLSVIMCGIIVSIYYAKMKLFRFMAVTAFFSYLLFAFSKPDYQIAAYNVKHAEYLTSSDLRYLMSLSPDAAPAIAGIDPDEIRVNNNTDAYMYEQTDAEEMMENYFKDITLLTENTTLRKFNLSRYQARKTAFSYLGD